MDSSFGLYMSLEKSNWLLQRITAIALIPLVFWFIYKMAFLEGYTYNEVLFFFKSRNNSLLFLMMAIIMIYHSKLGLLIIIEDYINKISMRKKIIFTINFITYFLIVVLVLSIFIIKFVS